MMALREKGATEAEAYSKIWLVDSKGLIVKVRSVTHTRSMPF